MLTLNILEKYLLPIIAGDKTFEIREKRDRNLDCDYIVEQVEFNLNEYYII